MTKKEAEILADIRNKFTPILTFFELWERIIKDTSLTKEQQEDMFKLICDEQDVSFEAVKKVANLLKSI